MHADFLRGQPGKLAVGGLQCSRALLQHISGVSYCLAWLFFFFFYSFVIGFDFRNGKQAQL